MNALNPPALPQTEVTTRLKRYGLRFRYDPNTYTGRFLYYRGIFEEQILLAIERMLGPGMTFVDVGANIGVHTVVTSKLVGQSGSVISFEPGQQARARLKQNIALNQLSNITVHSCALGRESGTATLYTINKRNDGQCTLVSDGTSCRTEMVDVMTLDSVIHESDVSRGCVLKIDVEGGEMDVFEGGKNFIREARPKAIFVECIDSYLKRFGSSSAELLEWLWSAGYVTKALIRGSWAEIDSPVDCDMMATPRRNA